MSLIAVDRNSGVAVYNQISVTLREEIGAIYKPGDFLPSEIGLAERFGVNRHTIRRAIDELISQGHVERRHGRGTMVVEPPLDYSIHKKSRFTESLAAKGKKPNNSVIRKIVVPATGEVCERLKLNEGAEVLLLETLRQVDKNPFCLISHFIPKHGFEVVDELYSEGSLHDFLEKETGITLHRKESLITSILPRGDDAVLLKMPQTMPVLRVKSLNVNQVNGRPVEFAITRFRSDRIQLSVNF